jgi:signal transduction histidine kinase
VNAPGNTAVVSGLVLSSLRRVVDVAVPLLVALLWVAVAYEASSLGQHQTPATLLGAACGVVQGAALWWRRSRPVLVMGITLAGGLVTLLLYPEQVFPYGPLVAIGSVAAARPPRVSLAALAGLLALTALNYVTGDESAEDVTFVMIFPIAIWSMGEAVRNRRAAIEAAPLRAVSEEQARISRELHDVIAHNVSVIVVQAAAANDVFDERPDQARAALLAIEATGRDALGELRRVLAVVRPDSVDSSGHGDGSVTAAVPPGLGRLAELSEPLRAAGLQVTIRRGDDVAPMPLPAAVDLSAYRIVQEALTNTLRHAHASRADVTVRTEAGALDIDVVDDAPAVIFFTRPRCVRGLSACGAGRPAADARACRLPAWFASTPAASESERLNRCNAPPPQPSGRRGRYQVLVPTVRLVLEARTTFGEPATGLRRGAGGGRRCPEVCAVPSDALWRTTPSHPSQRCGRQHRAGHRA